MSTSSFNNSCGRKEMTKAAKVLSRLPMNSSDYNFFIDSSSMSVSEYISAQSSYESALEGTDQRHSDDDLSFTAVPVVKSAQVVETFRNPPHNGSFIPDSPSQVRPDVTLSSTQETSSTKKKSVFAFENERTMLDSGVARLIDRRSRSDETSSRIASEPDQRNAYIAELAAKARLAELTAAAAQHQYFQAQQELQRQLETNDMAKNGWGSVVLNGGSSGSVPAMASRESSPFMSHLVVDRTFLGTASFTDGSFSHLSTPVCLESFGVNTVNVPIQTFRETIVDWRKDALPAQRKKGPRHPRESPKVEQETKENMHLAESSHPHATVAESITVSKPSTSKKGPRPKDMPRHPLTAYNFFFSDERERILRALGESSTLDSCDCEEEYSKGQLSTEEKRKKLLEHLERRREQKNRRRPHRKTHGKISFKELATLIGQRWRELPTQKLSYYHELAEMDMTLYKKAMAEYKSKKALERREGTPPNKCQ